MNDKAPKMKPNVMENKLVSLLFDNSVAGMSNDQIEDEIIIPAGNLKIFYNILYLNYF